MKGSKPDKAEEYVADTAKVVAVCISPGGVPKKPVDNAVVKLDGLVGDGHSTQMHLQPHRAVLIQDIERRDERKAEGYPVGPGVMGENVTVRNLNVQHLAPGCRLVFEEGPILELSEPRTPCYVLRQIHDGLEQAVVGRGGFLARVEKTGSLHPGQRVMVESKSTG